MRYVMITTLFLSFIIGTSAFAQDEKVTPLTPPSAGLLSKQDGGEKMNTVLPQNTRLTPKAGMSETKAYQVGIEDVLDISIIKPIPSTNRMTVTSDGTITFPYIGSVQAKGRTLSQIQSEIQTRLGDYMDYPIVSVSLAEAGSMQFTVYGQVSHPGSYPVQGDMSLLRAISVAGGLSTPGSIGEVKVLRPHKNGNGKSVIFDSDINTVLNGTQQDIPILAGDTVVVTIGMFFIYGEVSHPGSYPVDENMSLLNAITIAGGFVELGSTGVVKLFRPKSTPKEMSLDIKAIQSGKDQGLTVQTGDNINVIADKFYIYGQVAHPGTYPVSDNMDVMNAISAAGGFVESGSMGRIKLYHSKPQMGESPVYESDIRSILASGNRIIVHAGDTIDVSLDEFFVSGQVNHPGAYPVKDHMSLLNAISTAGGLTGATGMIKILRPKMDDQPEQEVETDFASVLNGTAPDVHIQAWDNIVVLANNFYVYGEVNRPGMYPLDSKTTALTAISIAGGFTKFGSGSHVKVVRMNEKTGSYETAKVNIQGAIEGNSKADVLLEPGDIVVVSEGIF